MEAPLNAATPDGVASAVTLVKFAAGKLTKEGSSTRVVADPRRGTFQIVVTPDDMLTHLQWRPRGAAAPEDDLIIFPGEAELVPVQSSPDRVFVLKWKEGTQRLFIWMQSADPDGDVVHVETVNQVLTDGPSGTQSLASQDSPETDAVREPAMPSVPGASHRQLTASSPSSDARASITLEALQQAMTGASNTGSQPVTPTIGELLHPDLLGPAFESEAMADALPELLELLPRQDSIDVSALTDVLRSPGLRAQAGALTNAMASGGVQDLLASFGFPCDDPSAATAVGAAGVQVFLRALKNISDRQGALRKK